MTDIPALIERLESPSLDRTGILYEQELRWAMHEAAEALRMLTEWNYDMSAAPKDGTAFNYSTDEGCVGTAKYINGSWFNDAVDTGMGLDIKNQGANAWRPLPPVPERGGK